MSFLDTPRGETVTVFEMIREGRVVADGVQWSDGQINIKWRGAYRSNTTWPDFLSLHAVSGHDGDADAKPATTFRSLVTLGDTP